ncbi:MAG: ATP-binding protein [Anaerotruncus sp.]|nr:ATP-binding protein [Anaerotruncus sp.]
MRLLPIKTICIERAFMKEKVTSSCTELKNLIDGVGTIQTAWGLFVSGVLIIAFIFCVFIFNSKINKVTKVQVQRFQKEGKYLPPIYIELNNSMEYLRYFIFSHRWKHRIIRQYNHLFHGYEGERLKQLLGPSIKCSLSYFTAFWDLKSALSTMHDELERLRKNRNKLYDKHGEVVWAITNSTYNHIYAIEHLQNLCAMISQKNVILVGSAGNGKTSLLCRMAEVAVANKIPCLLINSRDIKEDCAEYILKRVPLFAKFRNITPFYLKLVSLMLFLQKKYFYIFVDAINENDREIFINSISTLLETFSNYNRIRILLTCRREYFDSRYKKLFSAGKEEPYIFNLQEAEYDERATKKMIRAYMEYFNVRGPFSLETQEKLKNSLFLTRIFFEVNCNRDECMLEFRNAEIYKLYFEKIASENKNINLSTVINSIAQYMFDKFQFDKIPIEELRLSSRELDSLRNLLDNNLIISHSVYTGTGITEREEDYIYFVFDELRDFCLARYLLTLDESNSSTEYKAFFLNVSRLFKQRLSPVEGMVKYAYHHFRMTERIDLCENILKIFGESDVQSILDKEKRGLNIQRTFNNFGFSLVFSEGDNIASFEVDYILHCMKNNCRQYWEIFWFLLQNEYSKFKPNIHLAVDILRRCENDEFLEEILKSFFDDRAGRYFSYFDRNRQVDDLKEWLDAIKKNNGTLSENLKVMVTILAAYEPTEFALKEYHHFVTDEEFFRQIQESDLCDSLKLLISNFRDWITPKPTDLNAFQVLMDTLKEGYYE